MPLQLPDDPAPKAPSRKRGKGRSRVIILAFLAFPLLLVAGPVGLSCFRPYQADLGPFSLVAFVRAAEPGRAGYSHYYAGAGEVRQLTVPLGSTAWNLRWIHWLDGHDPKGVQFTFMD